MPAAAIPTGWPVQILVDALAADGTAQLRNDPQFTPPPPPAVSPPSPPGTYPLWPTDDVAGSARNTPTAIAQDFATRALGVANAAVTVDPSASANGPTVVKIFLPAAGHDLTVLTEPGAAGTWEIIQVGDQSNQRGITMAPNGVFGPVMSLLPPSGAATADVVETAADGTHRIQLSPTDLAARVVHLVGNPIHTVVIVYRDPTGAAIDAIGAEFG
jgi:hypothetical protein